MNIFGDACVGEIKLCAALGCVTRNEGTFAAHGLSEVFQMMLLPCEFSI